MLKSNTRQIKLIRKKDFATALLDPEDKNFVIYVAFLTISNINKVYPFQRAQIVSFQVNKASTIIFLEYFNYGDIFFPKLVVELLKYTKINIHTIDYIDSKQPCYG